MSGSCVRAITTFAYLAAASFGAIWWLALAQGSKEVQDRAKRMRELAIQWSALTQKLEGPPGRISEDERREIDRKRYDLILEAAKVFRDGPCAEAVAELFTLGEQPGHEWLWVFEANLARVASFPYYQSYLTLLEGKDEGLNKRLGPALDLVRKQFGVIYDHPYIVAFEDFIRRYAKTGQTIPSWFIDGAYRDVRDGDKALELFWRHDEQAKKELDWADIEWALHLIKTYSWRVEHSEAFRRRRTTSEDLKQARQQLEWLWGTKRWWAQRYVIEVLVSHRELAFRGAAKKIRSEGHPYIAERVKQLEELNFLESLERYEKMQK